MRFLQKIIYYFCYLLYKAAIKVTHHEVKTLWYRNSLCFDYWTFLKSDIDITIVFERATKRLMEEVSYTHSLFRRYFPIIGELVIYSDYHEDALLSCVNAFELQRDPFLIQKYDLKPKGDLYDKIIFLHKFIGANWSKKDMDSVRPEKVEFIINHLELGPLKPFRDLIDDLSSMIGVDQKEFRELYIKELENQAENIIHKQPEHTVPNIIFSLFYNRLCYLTPHHELTITEKKIIEKNVLWEIWGYFSYQTQISRNQLKSHIDRLTSNLDKLVHPSFKEEAELLLKELTL